MRKMVITFLALGVFAASSAFASNAVRISQVYAGGGSGTGYYAYDYVELFNSSCLPIDMSGWQLQYGSATGLFASNTFGIATLPAGAIIQPCGYYLVQCGTAGNSSYMPVTADFANAAGPNLGATAGKVALLPAGTATAQTCAVIKPLAIDLYGWGTANCSETAAGLAGGTSVVAIRNGGGLNDTDNNSADFQTPAQPVPMHNAAGGFTNAQCVNTCTSGACCLRNAALGACLFVPATQCAILGGIFMGIGHACNPGECAVPTTKTSWGQVKTIYR